MITIQLTKPVVMNEVDAMLEWLRLYAAGYEFTGTGIELLTFKNELDAIAFKLKFNI